MPSPRRAPGAHRYRPRGGHLGGRPGGSWRLQDTHRRGGRLDRGGVSPSSRGRGSALPGWHGWPTPRSPTQSAPSANVAPGCEMRRCEPPRWQTLAWPPPSPGGGGGSSVGGPQRAHCAERIGQVAGHGKRCAAGAEAVLAEPVRRLGRVGSQLDLAEERLDHLGALVEAVDPARCWPGDTPWCSSEPEGADFNGGAGRLVRNVSDVAVGDRLGIRLADGTVAATVSGIGHRRRPDANPRRRTVEPRRPAEQPRSHRMTPEMTNERHRCPSDRR